MLARQRLGDLAQRRAFRRSLERIQDQQQRVDELGDRVHRAIRQRLERMRQEVQARAGKLQSLSPLNVLGRGYSLTRRACDQQVIRSAEQVRPGDVLTTVVQHGQITSRVEESAPPARN